MVINEKEYPLVLQAYETSGDHEQFIAEQVVHNQFEADNFATRCSGLLIKSMRLVTKSYPMKRTEKFATKPRSYSAVLIVLTLLIVALIVAGFTTGWVQRTFDWPVGKAVF